MRATSFSAATADRGPTGCKDPGQRHTGWSAPGKNESAQTQTSLKWWTHCCCSPISFRHQWKINSHSGLLVNRCYIRVFCSSVKSARGSFAYRQVQMAARCLRAVWNALQKSCKVTSAQTVFDAASHETHVFAHPVLISGRAVGSADVCACAGWLIKCLQTHVQLHWENSHMRATKNTVWMWKSIWDAFLKHLKRADLKKGVKSLLCLRVEPSSNYVINTIDYQRPSISQPFINA